MNRAICHFNSLATDRRSLVSERLEQVTPILMFEFQSIRRCLAFPGKIHR